MDNIFSPEMETRFNSLDEGKQKIICDKFTDEVKKLVAKMTDESLIFPIAELNNKLRNMLLDIMDEVEGKRRGLWLL